MAVNQTQQAGASPQRTMIVSAVCAGVGLVLFNLGLALGAVIPPEGVGGVQNASPVDSSDAAKGRVF